MITTDTPIHFKRLQFPVRVAFEMTINKSQRQSFQICGFKLSKAVVSPTVNFTWHVPVPESQQMYLFTTQLMKQ